MSRLALAALLAVALLSSVVPVSAQEATPAGGPYSATDANGATVSFDAPPERIVCNGYGCDVLLAELDVVPVASGLLSFYDPTWTPLFGERGGEVVSLETSSVEEVAALEPDLIVGHEAIDNAALEVVAPVFVLAAPQDGLDAQLDNLLDLGALTGRTEAALAAVERFGAVVDAVAARVPAGAVEATVMQMGAVPDAYIVGIAAQQPFCAVLAERGLGACVPETGERFPNAFGEVAAEAVLAADPDLILYAYNDRSTEVPGPDARTDAVWPQLGAVQTGRIVVDGSGGSIIPALPALQWTLERYAVAQFPDAGYPDPGPWSAYDPERPANLAASDATPTA